MYVIMTYCTKGEDTPPRIEFFSISADVEFALKFVLEEAEAERAVEIYEIYVLENDCLGSTQIHPN